MQWQIKCSNHCSRIWTTQRNKHRPLWSPKFVLFCADFQFPADTTPEQQLYSVYLTLPVAQTLIKKRYKLIRLKHRPWYSRQVLIKIARQPNRSDPKLWILADPEKLSSESFSANLSMIGPIGVHQRGGIYSQSLVVTKKKQEATANL